MKRWEAITKNGDDVTEDDLNWELVKDKVNSLSLNNNGQIVTLPDNMEYIQGKSACASLGGGKVEVLSRYIGIRLGNNIVKVRVNEKTNDISIEVTNESNNLHSSE
jgi:hypothetical protein